MENVKYVVLSGHYAEVDPEGDGEWDTAWEQFPPVFCENADAVSDALDEVIDKGGDWSVWEMVDGKPQRRSCVWSPVFEIRS